MNTKQLWYALTENPITESYFDGVFPIDALAHIKNKPDMIICNTDPSYKPGEHWVLFFFNDDKSVDFFDSLGKTIKFYGLEFESFASKFANEYRRSTQRIQPFGSKLCGQYCLYYAYKRCKGESMESIIGSIKSSDDVINFVNKNFKVCKSNSCHFQCCINQ